MNLPIAKLLPKEKPVLSAQDMANFLMTTSFTKEYRKRNLALFREIHEPGYADEVERFMMQIHKGKK